MTLKEALCSRTSQRAMCLLVACLSKIMAGTANTFVAFGADLKQEFQLSQTTIEVILSVANVGAACGYPAGLLYEKIGLKACYGISLVAGAGSSILLYSTQFTPQFYQDNPVLLVLYWTCYGLSTVYLALLPLAVCLGNFPKRHRGRVSGFLYMFTYVGVSSGIGIYAACFSGGSVGNYFLCLTVATVVVNILSLCFIRPIAVEEESNAQESVGEGETLLPKDDGLFVADLKVPDDSLSARMGWTHFRLVEFQLLLWGFLLSGSLKLMYLPNVTMIAVSYWMKPTGDLLAVIGPVCAMVAALLVGPLADCTRQMVPRVFYLALGAFLQSTVFLISVFIGNQPSVYIATTVVVYTDLGILFATTISVLGEYFGLRHFARNWGLITMLNAFLALGTCAALAYVYEAAIPKTRENFCFELHCFRNTYMFAHTASVVSVILFGILCYRDRRQRRLMLLSP